MTTTTPEIDATERPLLAAFDAMGADYVVHRHPPLFTVEESKAQCGDLPGAHLKNMFLKDKKGDLWLVSCLDDRRIRIRDLEKQIGAPRMSFGKPELLWDALGVRPGAVTPFALWNDREAQAVTPIVDQSIWAADLVNAHPLHNEATVAIAPAALRAFMEGCGHTPIDVDFDALEAAAE